MLAVLASSLQIIAANTLLKLILERLNFLKRNSIIKLNQIHPGGK